MSHWAKALRKWLSAAREALFGRRQNETERSRTGQWGEDVAAKFLRSEGYSVIARRVRPDRDGDEIDIIAQRDGVLAIVEVKTRADEFFGRPAVAVNRRKRNALRRGAAAYLRRAGMPRMRLRFDIVEVVGSRDSGTKPVVRHIKGAFAARGCW
jgi:putative endonuclease